MSGIEVTKQENSWQVVTKNGTFTVEDTNGNGRIDKKDLWSAANGAKLPTIDEREEAMGLSLKKEKMTAEEMDEYDRFQQRQQAKEQQQQYQQQTQTPKKMNIWQKIGVMSTALLPMFSGLTGMFMGMGMGSWAYNSGNGNDTALRIMGGTTGALFGMSSAMSAVAMMKGMNNMPSGGFNTGGYNNNIGSGWQQAVEAQNQWMEAQQKRQEEYLEQVKEQREQRETEEKKTKYQKAVQNEVDKVSKDDTGYEKKNADYIKSLEDVDGEREYTDEEIEKLKKIKNAPSIPADHVGEDASDKTKLSPSFAKILNDRLAQYEKLDEEGSDNKFKHLTKEHYNEIKKILAKDKLTEADVTRLKTIYKEEKERKD